MTIIHAVHAKNEEAKEEVKKILKCFRLPRDIPNFPTYVGSLEYLRARVCFHDWDKEEFLMHHEDERIVVISSPETKVLTEANNISFDNNELIYALKIYPSGEYDLGVLLPDDMSRCTRID